MDNINISTYKKFKNFINNLFEQIIYVIGMTIMWAMFVPIFLGFFVHIYACFAEEEWSFLILSIIFLPIGFFIGGFHGIGYFLGYYHH
jgi:hypothetical protein